MYALLLQRSGAAETGLRKTKKIADNETECMQGKVTQQRVGLCLLCVKLSLANCFQYAVLSVYVSHMFCGFCKCAAFSGLCGSTELQIPLLFSLTWEICFVWSEVQVWQSCKGFFIKDHCNLLNMDMLRRNGMAEERL